MGSEVTDLEDIVTRWAWQMFDTTKSKDQARLPREALNMTINYKKAHFDHSEPEYTDKEKPPDTKSQTLFRTFFTNKTNQDQEYSFKTERVTRSCAEMQFEKAYTVGQEMSIALKTPCEVFEANAGFHRELTLTDSHGQTFEEEMTWGVDSLIKVPPHTKTTAKLVIAEDKFSGKFQVTTKIYGKIHVAITNTKDNNSFLKSIDGDIVDIIKREVDNGLKGFEIKNKKARFTTRGRCNFAFAIEQHVELSQVSLTEEQLAAE